MSTLIDLGTLGSGGFVLDGTFGDELGASVSAAGDVNGDGYADLLIGAPYNNSGGTDSGIAYVVYGGPGGFENGYLSVLPPDAGFRIIGDNPYDTVGLTVSGAGDFNADGYADLIVAADRDGLPGRDTPLAYVIFGTENRGTIDLSHLASSDGFRITGLEENSPSPSDVVINVSNAGDLNDDGYDDIVVGTPISDTATVIFGTSATVGGINLGSLGLASGFSITGASGGGVSTAGDINADGVGDLIITGAGVDGAGAAYVLFGHSGAFSDVDLANLSAAEGFAILGAAPGDEAGRSVAGAGDVNGDGIDDLIVGARQNDDGGTDAGAAYVVFGRQGGSGTIDLSNLGTAGFVIQGDASGDRAGWNVSELGDINNDGFADLIVSATDDDYVIFGRAGSARIDLGNLDPSAGFVIHGVAVEADLLGTAAGDIDGDGLADLLVGSRFNEFGGDQAGRVYVVFSPFESQTILGTSGDDHLTGASGNDTLAGLAGNDRLDGGTGADNMAGGPGDDSYYVDDSGDRVIENPGEGIDLVYSSISYSLGSNVENLALTGSAAIDGTGNALDNLIKGNAGANILNGGAGVDRFYGGGGDDTYIIDNLGDRVAEASGQGTDLVKSSVSFEIGSNVENLTLTGSGAISGTGNNQDNLIKGNGAANLLNGGGGADRFYGGNGNDTYIIENVGDRIAEASGQGTDLVKSSVSFELGSNVENLTLTGSVAIDATGNSQANVIIGNSAANRIAGGAGGDHLTGGGGADTFVFGTGQFGGMTTSTCDEITDFASGHDLITFRPVDANSLVAGDQTFDFIGTSAFSGTAGELRFEQISGNTYITGDTNGDGLADFMLRVHGSHLFVTSDFGL